jgi:glycerophosphoryl diester phosphodiesterase
MPRLMLPVLAGLLLGSIVRGDEPRIVAHRGLLRHAPENTLANFRACLGLRLGFELDVRRSRDGILVCLHDETLDRTTDGTGPVSEKSLGELKRLDAGSWFDPRFRGQRIPTLDEVFRLAASPAAADVLIAVDLKASDIEADVVALASRHGVLDRLLMIGNAIDNPAVRKKLKADDPKAQVACVANNDRELPAAIDDSSSDWVYVRYVPTRNEIERIHRAGKKCFIAGATVSGEEFENWTRAARAGIDAVLTDYPLSLARQLRTPTRRETP